MVKLNLKWQSSIWLYFSSHINWHNWKNLKYWLIFKILFKFQLKLTSYWGHFDAAVCNILQIIISHFFVLVCPKKWMWTQTWGRITNFGIFWKVGPLVYNHSAMWLGLDHMINVKSLWVYSTGICCLIFFLTGVILMWCCGNFYLNLIIYNINNWSNDLITDQITNSGVL